jgi:hypothetical protein
MHSTVLSAEPSKTCTTDNVLIAYMRVAVITRRTITDKEVQPCHSNRSLHPHIINRSQVNEHTEPLPRLMETFRFRHLPPQQIILVIHPSRSTQPLETAGYVKQCHNRCSSHVPRALQTPPTPYFLI